MFRWFREILDPVLRCARLGHWHGIEWREGYCRPNGYGNGVARSVRQERVYCRRCKAAILPWEDVDSRHIDSLSAPIDIIREFEANGEVWLRGGTH